MGEFRMWKRKELKARARKVVKKNYWTAVVVCFLIAVLTSEFGGTIVGIWQEGDSIDPNYLDSIIILKKQLENQNENDQEVSEDNISLENVGNEDEKQQHEISYTNEVEQELTNIDEIVEGEEQDSLAFHLKVANIIKSYLNSITKSQKYLFKIWDATRSFLFEQIDLGIALIITSIIAIAFTVFIEKPLIVGEKQYFLKARQNSNTKIGVLKNAFKKEHWLNIAIIMILKAIYNFLWYFTIIGGFIKFYEYRMIPYILAENPKIKRKEAFKLSKEMMRGNKWRTFILDMSFFLWHVLSVFTFGLLNLFYTNLYTSATTAELYMVLRNTAIKEKYQYYESLNDKNLK